MISTLILTYQEEQNLPACLEALRWCDDIVVVDSGSTDRTLEIATSFGARVLTRRFDDFATQRNFGLTNGEMRHPWVLHIDADEIVTSALVSEMRETIAATSFAAFRVSSKLMFRNQWLRHAGMYPAYQVRFGRRGDLVFQQVGHGQRELLPPERVGTLREPLLHYSFEKGIGDWIEKHNRYSTAEALHFVAARDAGKGTPWRALFRGDTVEHRRALKELSARMPARPLLRFLYMYFLRRGILDGRAGYTYCRMLAMYELMIDLKVEETLWQRESK